jgi:hypothetical protein
MFSRVEISPSGCNRRSRWWRTRVDSVDAKTKRIRYVVKHIPLIPPVILVGPPAAFLMQAKVGPKTLFVFSLWKGMSAHYLPSGGMLRPLLIAIENRPKLCQPCAKDSRIQLHQHDSGP